MQKNKWQQLVNLAQKNHLPHALLFVGEKGTDKKKFARDFAEALLCQHFKTKGQRCGQCKACYLTQAGSHPDLIWVESEPGHAIKVDAIRDVIHFVNQTPLLEGYRIIIIHPADAMNSNAANALLKTLEEPTSNTLFILISEQSTNLPATIVSRCQKIVFHPGWDSCHPERSVGSPDVDAIFRKEFFHSLTQLSEQGMNPIVLAEQWHEKDPVTLLNLLFSWTKDLLILKTTHDSNLLVNQDFKNELMSLSNHSSSVRLTQYIDHLQEIKKYIYEGINLNKRLMVEDLLNGVMPAKAGIQNSVEL